MNLLQTLLVYMSLVFTTSVQTAPVPSVIPETPDYPVRVEATAVPTPTPSPVPTVDITPNPGYKTLQMGDKGAAVREMQEKLLEYGYYDGEVDGAYGNQTRRAVEHFQYMHGLTVDGIAGRRTLTVLFEYQEVRAPQYAEETPVLTPEPTPTAKMTAAYTPVPATPAPTAAAVPVQKPSVQQPADIQEMSGFSVVVNDTATELKAFQNGETIYLPIVELLRAAGVNVISSSTLELDEYAFASGAAFVRFTCTANQAGDPVDLQAYANDKPQLLPDRSLYRYENTLYVPLSSIEAICNFEGTIEETDKRIVIRSSAE